MRQHPFSMVEILLALGVVAIGICSIMVLFPIGATATRDAEVVNYASQAADQLLSVLKYNLTYDKSVTGKSKTAWDKVDALTTVAQTDIESACTAAQANLSSGWVAPSSTNSILGGEITSGNLFVPQSTTNAQIFLLVSRSDGNTSIADLDTAATNGQIDFKAIATLTRQQIRVGSNDLPYTMGARFVLEIRWPVELPYSAQQSEEYILEIMKPTFE
ncbi:MAG: hypothetical protein IJJ33_00755 [Victivallales bacterium]|nr:hypothetical protein [Victivallales bacterium]